MEYCRCLAKASGQTLKKILDYVFESCDTIYFHSEKSRDFLERNSDTKNDEFDIVTKNVFKKEIVVNYGMDVLRIWVKPTEAVKNFLYRYGLNCYYYSTKEKYAPYVEFADVAFSKNGVFFISCLTHEGYFDATKEVNKDIQQLYDSNIRLDADFLEIESKIKDLQKSFLCDKSYKEFVEFTKKGCKILSLINGTTRHFDNQYESCSLTKEEYSLTNFKQTVKHFYPSTISKAITPIENWLELDAHLLEKLDDSYEMLLDVISMLRI